MKTKLLTLSTALLSLITLCGVAVHENKIDKLISASLSASLASVAAFSGDALRTEPHTHVHHVTVKAPALAQTVPADRLRHGEFKQYLSQQNMPRGRHPFDNFLLPVIS